jgi:isoleucyl-tRNA synthetase
MSCSAKPGATDGGLWEQKKAADPELPDHLMVHKPYIDAWTYDSPFEPGARR